MQNDKRQDWLDRAWQDETGARGLHVIPRHPLLTSLTPGVGCGVVFIVWVHTDTMQLLQHGPSGRITYPSFTHRRCTNAQRTIFMAQPIIVMTNMTESNHTHIDNGTTYKEEWRAHEKIWIDTTDRHTPTHTHTQVQTNLHKTKQCLDRDREEKKKDTTVQENQKKKARCSQYLFFL